MSDALFDKNFVFCSICHQRAATGNPLILTSCAHILCDKHLSMDNICPICKTNDISTVRLVEQQTLPKDVKLFFQPLPTLIENIYNISIFQINGLNEQIHYYQSHCIKLREKVARQQQLLYQAKNELDKIPLLKQKIQYLEDSIQSITRNVSTTNKNKTPVTKDHLKGSKHKVSSFFNRKTNTSFGLNSTDSYVQTQPPPTVDLTIDNDDYNDQQQQQKQQQQQNFVSKLRRSQALRHNTQKSLQYKDFSKEKDQNNRDLYSKNKRSTNVRANTISLSSYKNGQINNKRNLRINDSIASANGHTDGLKLYDDLIAAESTQINKFNSSSEYILQPTQNTFSPERIQFKTGIQSPRSNNNNNNEKYGHYYTENNKQYRENDIPMLKCKKANLITPPEKNLSSNTTNNNSQIYNDKTQRKRMNTTLASGRIHFPTPLEKLKIGKRKPITNNSPTMAQYLKRRSATSQIILPSNFANNKNTINNGSIGNKQLYRGQTSTNNYK